MVIGETLDNEWLYIHPKRLHMLTQARKSNLLYYHAMCRRRDWEGSGLEQVVIYIPYTSEPIRVWQDGNVTTAGSLLQGAMPSVQNVAMKTT